MKNIVSRMKKVNTLMALTADSTLQKKKLMGKKTWQKKKKLFKVIEKRLKKINRALVSHVTISSGIMYVLF